LGIKRWIGILEPNLLRQYCMMLKLKDFSAAVLPL